MEYLALKWAVAEKFREYLLGAKFTVYTDNNPLSYLMMKSKLGAFEMGWVAQLAQFDFDIVYRSGRTNLCADALSRLKHQATDGIVTAEQVQAVFQQSASCSILSTPLMVAAQQSIQVWVQEASSAETANQEPVACTDLPCIERSEIQRLQQEATSLQAVLRLLKAGHRPTA